MFLDLNTLFSLTVNIETMLGLLLLFVWFQNTRAPAIAWWGSAHLIRALSIVLYGFYGSVPDLISIDLANAMLFTSYAAIWNGARVFEYRKPLVGSLFAGATAWAIASLFPQFADAPNLHSLLSAVIVGTFFWLTAYEFWRGRREPLLSRWPAIFILFIEGSVFMLRTPLSAFLQPVGQPTLLSSAWLTVISTEAVLSAVSLAFILLSMARERTEAGYKVAALNDPLTGLGNRRDFLHQAADLLNLQLRRNRPVAVLMVDLDRFKSINDRLGHSMGDRVLQIFAETARANLRSSDLVWRLGGDEFVILLADAGLDNAFSAADRVRRTFANSANVIHGQQVGATLSMGVCIIQRPEQDLSELMAQADKALYRAKMMGGNHVNVSVAEQGGGEAQTGTNVVSWPAQKSVA